MKTLFLNFTRNYRAHLICWALLVAYEVLLVGMLTQVFGSFLDYFLHYAIDITFFYVHARILLPWLLRKRFLRFLLVPLAVAGEVALYTATNFLFETVATRYWGLELTRPLVFDYLYCLRSTWRAIYFMAFATGYFYLRGYFKERQKAERAAQDRLLDIIENQQLRTELVKSQNAFLKAQINPHFLFNTLSFVYNNVRKTSSQAAEAILSLSQMMRYALQNEDELQESYLLEEIEHVESLIHIHQIRHDHQLSIRLCYSDNLQGVRIIPLLLITMVENMFKHGQLESSEQEAQVCISLTGDTLSITTSNAKARQASPGHGIGLENIRNRLSSAYQDQASLEISTDTRGFFVVSLKVILQHVPAQPRASLV